MQELKANPNRAGKGAVIEARLDKDRGPIATAARPERHAAPVGDIIIAGTAVGRVRVMTNDKGAAGQGSRARPSRSRSPALPRFPSPGDDIQRRLPTSAWPASSSSSASRRSRTTPTSSTRRSRSTSLFAKHAGGRDEGAEPHRQGRRAGLCRGRQGHRSRSSRTKRSACASSTPASARSTSPTSCWPPRPTPSSSASTSARTTLAQAAAKRDKVDMRHVPRHLRRHQRDRATP